MVWEWNLVNGVRLTDRLLQKSTCWNCAAHPGERCSEQLQELRAHWIVMVDFDDRKWSGPHYGLELHLLLTKEEDEGKEMVLGPQRLGTFKKARLIGWSHVGDIKNLGGHTSQEWTYSLHSLAMNTFNEMTVSHPNQWSAHVNCQQFAKKLLQKLGLPLGETACGEGLEAPLVDCYCSLDKYYKWTKQ